MERKKASDFPPEVLKLFDGYIHGMLGRRDFLDRAAQFAAGGFTAAAMLESLTFLPRIACTIIFSISIFLNSPSV